MQCYDFNITAKIELTLGVDGLLVGKLFEHLGGTGESITRLTNATVDDHLVNLQLTHRVLCLLLLVGHDDKYNE